MESSIKSQLSVIDQRLDSIEANATSTELVSTNILYGSYTMHLLAPYYMQTIYVHAN